MADTILGDAIEVLQDFGFFDVILPFLLVFTLVFGILEKTRLFGTEKVGGNEFPKKNIDAMMAFTIAFFVVAAKEIVVAIQESLPLVVLILVAIISFLMLVGSFATSEKEFNFMETFSGWHIGFAVAFIIALIGIFFDSFGWLDIIWDYISGIGNEVFIIVTFVILTLGIMAYITTGGPSGGSE